MELYRVSNIHFYNDYKRSSEFVIAGMCLMFTGRGSIGIHLALIGFRLSIHFNTKSGIIAEAKDWEEAKLKLNEIVGYEALPVSDREAGR